MPLKREIDVPLRELQREADANKLLYENFLTASNRRRPKRHPAGGRPLVSGLPPMIPSFPKKTVLIGFSFLASIFVASRSIFAGEAR